MPVVGRENGSEADGIFDADLGLWLPSFNNQNVLHSLILRGTCLELSCLCLSLSLSLLAQQLKKKFSVA
jgi:hypothetical protein